MKTWLRSLSELSSEQQKLVRMSPHKSCLVSGFPGSGKTQILTHRVASLIEDHRIPPERIRLFVCTDVLDTLLRSEMRKLGLPESTVALFDQWCRAFYIRHVSEDLPRIYVNGRVDFEKTRLGVLRVLRREKNLQKKITHALVDDGEDLTPEAVEILSLAAENITLAADPHHKIHGKTAPPFVVTESLNIHADNSILSRDFRSPLSIARLASLFIEDPGSREEYLSLARNERRMFPPPLFYVAPSREDEVDQLSHFIQLRQAKEENIGILLPTNRLVHWLAKELGGRGVVLEKSIPIDAQNVIHVPYDFESDRPKITTYDLARGLSFDSVLMPFLTERILSEIPPYRRQRLIFMGMVRASHWVYLSTAKGEECREAQILKSAEKDGHLTVIH